MLIGCWNIQPISRGMKRQHIQINGAHHLKELETRVKLFVLLCLTHFFVWQVVRRFENSHSFAKNNSQLCQWSNFKWESCTIAAVSFLSTETFFQIVFSEVLLCLNLEESKCHKNCLVTGKWWYCLYSLPLLPDMHFKKNRNW